MSFQLARTSSRTSNPFRKIPRNPRLTPLLPVLTPDEMGYWFHGSTKSWTTTPVKYHTRYSYSGGYLISWERARLWDLRRPNASLHIPIKNAPQQMLQALREVYHSRFFRFSQVPTCGVHQRYLVRLNNNPPSKQQKNDQRKLQLKSCTTVAQNKQTYSSKVLQFHPQPKHQLLNPDLPLSPTYYPSKPLVS